MVRMTDQVFCCATVLQKDRRVITGKDIRRMLQRRTTMWTLGNYDELMQDAIRCNNTFKSYQPK